MSSRDLGQYALLLLVLWTLLVGLPLVLTGGQ
jgi:hypothetical protein